MLVFYKTVFGLTAEAVPGGRNGFWLSFDRDQPALIHLIASEDATLPPAPQLEHVGFRATGLDAMVSRLVRLHHSHTVAAHPEFDTVRLNFNDPDGNRIHVDFPLSEHAGSGADRDP